MAEGLTCFRIGIRLKKIRKGVSAPFFIWEVRMKKICIVLLVLLILAGGILFTSCSQPALPSGLLQGAVTIGPIWPVEQAGQSPPVPPEVFSARKIMIYDNSGKNLIKEVNINQIGQTANGYYAVLLEPGTYTVNTNNAGIGGTNNLPKQINISAGETVTLDIDIDTGIR
jgi:hypothetical protein